jgi:GT2 family glycosyltransferase
MSTPLVSVIYVNYNSLHWVQGSIRSILEGHDPSGLEFIVVSNSDWGVVDPAAFLTEGCPTLSADRLHLHHAADNPGFSVANNLGAERSSGEFLYFLNPDTTVEAGSIDVLVRFLREHPQAGAVGPRTYFEDGTLQPSIKREFTARVLVGLMIPLPARLMPHQITHVVYENYTTRQVDTVNGSAIMVHRDTFASVGRFDEGYFLYFEEDDLCYRIRKSGREVWFVSESVIVHYEGKSSERMYTLLMVELNRSKRRFFARFKPEILDLDILLCRIAYSLRWLFNILIGNDLKSHMYKALTRYYFEDCYLGDRRIPYSNRKLQ